MRPTLSRSAILAAAVTLALLTACDSEDQTSDDAPWSPPSDVSTEPGADGFTPPGATLEMSATARVPYLDEGFADDPPVETELTVTVADPPEKGSVDDVPDDMTADAEGKTLYYIRAEVTNEGDAADIGGLVSMRAYDAEGDQMDHYATSEGPCAASLPSSGETATVCSFALTDGPEPAAIAYELDDSDYEDDPVYWRLPM